MQKTCSILVWDGIFPLMHLDGRGGNIRNLQPSFKNWEITMIHSSVLHRKILMTCLGWLTYRATLCLYTASNCEVSLEVLHFWVPPVGVPPEYFQSYCTAQLAIAKNSKAIMGSYGVLRGPYSSCRVTQQNEASKANHQIFWCTKGSYWL